MDNYASSATSAVECWVGDSGEVVYSFIRPGIPRRGKWSRLEEDFADRCTWGRGTSPHNMGLCIGWHRLQQLSYFCIVSVKKCSVCSVVRFQLWDDWIAVCVSHKPVARRVQAKEDEGLLIKLSLGVSCATKSVGSKFVIHITCRTQ